MATSKLGFGAAWCQLQLPGDIDTRLLEVEGNSDCEAKQIDVHIFIFWLNW